eukprot:GHVU01147274.1.p1 GENE.GHVU01147274.1~~GHVU01147274.1.p1  ORF type:complete len:718 (+),score=57.07 GHVU01147274.1:55-2208(+)
MSFLFKLVVVSAVTSAASHHRKIPKRSYGKLPRSYECPAGYELNGKTCSHTEFLPFEEGCPAGYQSINGSCVKYYPLLKRCPDSYRQYGEECVRQQILPAEAFCADHEMRHFGGDICEKQVPVEPFCPSGYHQEGAGCVQEAMKSGRCPDGFWRKGEHCVRTTTFPRRPECSNPEYRLSAAGNMCVKDVAEEPHCPSGYMRDMQYGCAVFTEKESKCPPGFTRTIGEQCTNTITFPKRPECMPGYILSDDDVCIMEIPVPDICPSGFEEEQHGGSCFQRVDMIRKCPQGFTSSGQGCLKHTQIAKRPECPPGYSLFGEDEDMCKKYVSVPSFVVCRHGTKEGSLCVTQEEASPFHTCRHGLTLKGTTCFSSDAYACSETTFQVRQQYNSGITGERHTEKKWPHYPRSHKLRVLLGHGGKKGSSKTDDSQFVYSKTPMMMSVNVPPRKIHRSCDTRPISEPATPQCPDGFEMKQGISSRRSIKCIKRTVVPVELVESPSREVTVAADFVCPVAGYFGPDCVDTETAEMESFCPPGFTREQQRHGDACFKRAAAIPQPHRIDRELPTYVCTHEGADPSSCTIEETVEMIYICPHDFGDAGEPHRCLKTAPMIQPPMRLVSTPTDYVCTQGTGPSCAVEETRPLEYFCPSGYSDDGSGGPRCVQEAPLQTPPDRTVTAPVQYRCHPGTQHQPATHTVCMYLRVSTCVSVIFLSSRCRVVR